jgi:hypothetical protein
MKNENTSSKFQEISKVLYLNPLFILIFALTCLNGIAQNVGRTEDGFHIINRQGEKLTKAYDFIQFAEFGHQLVSQNGKFGYLNKNGSIAIPLIYDVAYPFNGDFALVGNSGKYYHINKTNKVLDSMDWPKAPLVYNLHFLVANEGENKVFYGDGTELLSSSHQLTLASRAGIIEHNTQNDSVFQYVATSVNRELKLINVFSVIEAPSLTNQGYLCIPQLKEGKETYSVYDQYGKQLVSCDIAGVNPYLIQVVWNQFVYIPIGSPNLRPYQLGQETHFSMSELWMKDQKTLSPFTFQLCNKYENDQMILLKYSHKWLSFDGREVEGNNLFDDIVPGDEYLTPVKKGRKWYLLDHRLDSLIPLPYKQIHPIGMNKGRFFARMQEDGGVIEAKWSLVSCYNKTATLELYQVPLLPHDNSVYDQKSRYNWSPHLTEVIKKEKRVLLDYRGNEVWADPDNKAITIEDFFKVNFAFKFDDFKELPKRHSYKKNQVSMAISPIGSGINIQLTNTKKTGEPVELQDGYLQTVLEMKTNEGTWLKIGYLDPSWCGNSYYGGYLPPNKTASTIVNLPKGDQPIIVRVLLNEHSKNRIVSNEIQIKTNCARLWVDKYCSGYGCATKD